MITEAAYNGGSMFTTASSVQLTPTSPVVILVGPSGSPDAPHTVHLFDTTAHQIDPGQYGGPRFVVIKASDTGNVTVVNSAGATIATLTGQGVAEVSLRPGDNRWIARRMTWGTPRTTGRGSRAAIEAASSSLVLDPFCFVGDDCDYAGADPLDGAGGRHLVFAPMFEDVVEDAKNTDREPIRAADIIMPNRIPVRFVPGNFVPDPLHPLAATVLPPDFYTLLENGGNPYILEYDTASHDGASHNPYHARAGQIVGPPDSIQWFLTALNVTRKVWKKVLSYDVGSETHTIEIRFVMEYSSDESPLGQATNGVWGALFMLYVFASQIDPAFDDGDSFQAVGFGTTNAFTKDDPVLWGGAAGVSGGTIADKAMHPQLALAAAIKTTWHAPFQSEHVPLRDRKHVAAAGGGDARGYHREWGYRRPNCTPWVTDPERDEEFCTGCGDVWYAGVFYIALFGQTSGGFVGGAMTRGGGFPISAVPEYLCFENGLATGRTYLIPMSPGWDEEIGQLTGGNPSATISICTNGDDWPRTELDACTGHPTDKLGDIGGSHLCFKNDAEGEATQCCITIVGGAQYYSDQNNTAPSVATSREVCTRSITVFGPRTIDGVGRPICSVRDVRCEVTQTFVTQLAVFIDDYTYVFPSGLAGRRLTWKRHVPDPDQVFFNHTFEAADPDVVPEVGTWDISTDHPGVNSTNGAVNAKAVLLYEPADSSFRDMTVSATGLACTSASHALVARGTVDPVTKKLTGYVGLVRPTGAGTGEMLIQRFVDNVVTTLAGPTAIVLANDAVDLVLDVWGDEISVQWEVHGGGATGTLTANDCAIEEGGYPGLCTETASNAPEFADWVVMDTSVDFVEISAYIGYQVISLAFPAAAKLGYGKCEGTYNPECGECCEPEHCNCTTWSLSLVSATSTTWSGPADLTNLTAPTYCGGPSANLTCTTGWCDGRSYNCGQCPLPFECLSLCVATRCMPADRTQAEPNMCRGITLWCGEFSACE